MLELDEKRDYSRMEVDCEITYRMANSTAIHHARCTSISGAGMSFITDQAVALGKAIEIRVLSGKSITPPLVAFIETVRSSRQVEDGRYKISAAIKGIKAD